MAVNIRGLGTFHLALEEGQDDPQRLARAFVSCPRVTRILDVLSDRCGFAHASMDPTLQTEVWMRLWPLLPWNDEPQRIYSFIWRIAEYTAMGMVRKAHATENKEAPLERTADDDGEIADGADRQTDGGIELTQQDIDAASLRNKFLHKLQRVGWPDGIDPSRCSVMRQPGPKMRPPGSADEKTNRST